MARTVQAKPLGGKYPVPYIHITGRPETGKTQLAISFSLWLRGLIGKQKCYVWPTDGREHEYAEVLGPGNVLAPESNPLDIAAVLEEAEKDLRGKVFDNVGFVSVDTLTHLYRQNALINQMKTMTGEGSSGQARKAVAMMNVTTFVMMLNRPACVITHRYTASKQNVAEKRERETISDLEEQRFKLAFNIKVECFLDDKGYEVVVHECRERPGMKPFIIRDEPGGMFRTMPDKLMTALYVSQAPTNEATGWTEFGRSKPFPGTGDQFKKAAIKEMVDHFVELDGRRFYAFGDPAEVPTRKDGTPGVSGVVNHATNTYSQVAKKYKAEGGKNLGELTQLLKDEVEARIQEQIDIYLNGVAGETDPEDIPDGQAELSLDAYAEDAPQGSGAAYAE